MWRSLQICKFHRYSLLYANKGVVSMLWLFIKVLFSVQYIVHAVALNPPLGRSHIRLQFLTDQHLNSPIYQTKVLQKQIRKIPAVTVWICMYSFCTSCTGTSMTSVSMAFAEPHCCGVLFFFRGLKSHAAQSPSVQKVQGCLCVVGPFRNCISPFLANYGSTTVSLTNQQTVRLVYCIYLHAFGVLLFPLFLK